MPRRAAAVTVAASAAEDNSKDASTGVAELPDIPRFEKPALFALHSCGRSTRKLRNAIANVNNANVTRAADMWTPKTTHLVLPSLSRNVKIVCALAGGGQLARPSFVDLVRKLEYVPKDVPLEYTWDLSKQDAPRYHHDAAKIWRRRRAASLGGVLRGMRVFIVGELVPKRARGADGLISTTMAEAILEAADAVSLSSPEDADFALLTDVEIEKNHPAIPLLREADVPCFGPAILTDLIRRVEIKPPEFLAFKDQSNLCEKFVSAYEAENADVVPILVHRSSPTTHTSGTLTPQKTNSPRRKPKSSASAAKSPVVPERKLSAKAKSKASPRAKISKRRSRTKSKTHNQEKSVTKKYSPSLRTSSKDNLDKEEFRESPNGKRSMSSVEPVNLKLRIKRPRHAESKEPNPNQDTSIPLRSSCTLQPTLPSRLSVSTPTEPLTPAGKKQAQVCAPFMEIDASNRQSPPRRQTSIDDGSSPPEPLASHPDPVSLLLSLAKSPASAPLIPPNVRRPVNNASIPFNGLISQPAFSSHASPRPPVPPQATPKIPSIPVLPQAALPHFALPPSPSVQHSPAVPRIGMSPIGPLSLPPMTNHSITVNGCLSGRVPQLAPLPPDSITSNRAPSTLFSPVPNRQRCGTSDFTTLLVPLAASQPPLLGTPLHTPKTVRLSESPRKRKPAALEGDASGVSPATPENISESPMKRRRANGNGATIAIPPLDFRLAHGAQKALSQTHNEPTVPGSALTVRPLAMVTHQEDVSGGSAGVVRDIRNDFSSEVGSGGASVSKSTTTFNRSANKRFISTLVEDMFDKVCLSFVKPKIQVIVLDSDHDDEVPALLKTKGASNPRESNSPVESSSTRVKPSQVRKRPRRVIRESPPSDDDDENDDTKSSSLEIHRVRESQSSAPSRSSAEVNETQPVSTGSSKSRDQGHVRSNRVDAHLNRRRVQLRTPENNGTKSRLQLAGDGIDAKLTDELTAIAFGQFGKVPSVEDGYKSIVDWIGGEVSEGQLEQFANRHEHHPPKETQAKELATNAKKRPRGRGKSIVIHEDSPPEPDDQNSNATIDLVNDNCDIVEVREVDRPIRTQGHCHSHDVVSGKTDALFDVFDRPTKILVPVQSIPRHNGFLNRCAVNLDVACGVPEDDKRLLQETIYFKDWLYSAEHLDLNDEVREYLQNSPAANVMDIVHHCARSLQDADVFSHLAVLSDVDTSRLRSVVGICTRFLGSEQSKDLLGLFLELLLKARELQQVKSRDSLVYMLSKAGDGGVGSSKIKHELLLYVWIGLVDACRRFSGSNSISLLWTLFNEKWLGNSDRMPIEGNDPSSYKIVDSAADKLLDSLRTISCLFAFSLHPSDPSVDVRFILYPNWNALGTIVDKIVSRTYDSIGDHRKVLSLFLRKICIQFADKLWKVDEKFVVQVLDAVKSLCSKYDQPCSCTKVHSFLTQFNSISDLRARRRSLQDFLQTDCECGSFLAWVSVAQEDEMSSRLSAKILQHNSQFLRSKGVVKEPARALTHHLGLTLAISDCIVKGRGGKENLLRSMLFSKAPSVTRAVENPLNFDTRIVESWSAVLETVNLRCRHLLASGQSIHVYSEYIFENMFATLKCIERPESAKPLSIEERESRRVQQAVLVKLMVKMLTGFADIVKLVVQHVDSGHYSNFTAVESLLFSLSKFVERLGKFSVGLISQIRSSSIGGSALSRQEVLLAILTFVEQGLALCTVRTRQEKRVSAQRIATGHHNAAETSSGCATFSKQVQCEMLESFVNMVQSPVIESAPKLDADVRLAASRALARTVGLSCIGPNATYSMRNSCDLVGVVMRAKMTALGSVAGPVSASSAISNDTQALMKLELMMQTEFWSIGLDDAWSSAVLALNENFSEIVFGLWIILLVVSYAESKESDLARAVPKLSYGIQKAVKSNAHLAKWFREARQSTDNMCIAETDTELDMLNPKIRMETLTGCFSVVLNLWTSTKVQNLVTFIRQYIGLSTKNMNRKYEAFNASQNHWRTSRDMEDGEMALLHTQVLAVLFVVHATLCPPVPPSQYRGGRIGKEKSIASAYLAEISDSLMKAMNKLRKNGSEEAESSIQILVVTALATHGSGLNDVQTSVNFLRFLRMCGNGDSLANLITWNDESKVPSFMRRAPFTCNPSKARDEKEKQKYLRIQKRSRKVREVALSTLVEEPIQRKASNTLEFRTALERFCRLLRQKETVLNLRITGLWPNICQVVAAVGRRGNEAQREKVWEALRSEMQHSEAMYFKTSLRKAA